MVAEPANGSIKWSLSGIIVKSGLQDFAYCPDTVLDAVISFYKSNILIV
jgi:hypothetical protein